LSKKTCDSPLNNLLYKAVSPTLFVASAPFSEKQISIPPYQCRAEVWWCPGRLLDSMPP